MKLFYKLLILILAVSIAPLAVVGSKALSGLREEITDNVETMYRERAASASGQIAAYLDDAFGRIVQAVHFRRIGEMGREEMRSFVQDLIKQFDEIEAITVLDEIGEEMVSAVDGERFSPERLFAHLGTLGRKQLESATASGGGFSPVYRVDGVPRMTVFTPFAFKDDRGAPGMVAAGLSLEKVRSMVEAVGFSKSEAGASLLLDSEGRLIAGKMKGREWPELLAFEKLPLVGRARENLRAPGMLAAGAEEFLDPFGTVMMGAFAFVGKSGWMLLICEPKDRIFASADLLWSRVMAAILLTVIASCLAGLFFARRLLRPIQALVRGAEEIGAGNLDCRIERFSNDEIGVLGSAFTSMGQSLKNREITIGKIRAISGELSATFDSAKVLEIGSAALLELTDSRELRCFLCSGGGLVAGPRLGDKAELVLGEEVLKVELQTLDSATLRGGEGSWTAPELKNTIIAPLVYSDPNKGKVLKGLVVMGKESYCKLDLEVAQILSAAITVSLMNIEFVRNSVENERRAHELEIAELVQKTLYPEKDPELPGLELKSFIRASSETGGDWYGYLESEDRSRLTVLIGDVTGHGAPAALVTAATNGFLKTLDGLKDAIRANRGRLDLDLHSPRFLLSMLNRVILETARGRLVMTFFASTIDLKTGVMSSASAGHNPPWILRGEKSRFAGREDGARPKIRILGAKSAAKDAGAGTGQAAWEALTLRGARLGEASEIVIEEAETRLSAGDLIVWYTDGLLENTNPSGEPFGKKRMRLAIEEKSGAPLFEAVENLRRKSFEFYSGQPMDDDITLILGRVRREP